MKVTVIKELRSLTGFTEKKNSSALGRARKGATLTVALLALAAGAACRPQEEKGEGGTPPVLVVINAPASGVVRRVLVSEGVTVAEGAGLLEIAVETPAAARTPAADERARSTYDAAQGEVTEAEREVERTAVEAARVEPLVAQGAAPQAQLDAARAEYQRAQERLQAARDQAKGERTNLIAQEGGAESSQSSSALGERIVIARVPAGGTVKVINARAGQRVESGQPLATVATGAR